MSMHDPRPTTSLVTPNIFSPKKSIELRGAIAIIVGVVIGAGIFKAPSSIAGLTGNASWMLAAWLLGGIMSLVGALCYAELASAYPHTGGDYYFLRRAFGRHVSFLYAWARFSVITTGSIALLAFVFGDYMMQIFPIAFVPSQWGSAIYAATIVILLSWLNARGIKAGTVTQTWLTLAEIIGLLLIIIAGLFLIDHDAAGAASLSGETAATTAAPLATSTWPGAASFGLAMVFVLLTYGGWNEAAYISAELKDNRRNMVRAMVLSLLIITALYLLVTLAYWQGLGMTGMAKSEAIAADLLRVAFGPTGEILISVLIALAAVTSINATIIVGARSNYAVGRDWPMLAKLGSWDESRDTPGNAIRVQCLLALLLVLGGAWVGGGFKAMVEFTAPVFWAFFLLSGLSLLVLRAREPDTPRPFKVPWYPVLPLVFCAMCIYMLWASLSYVFSQALGSWNAAWAGVAVLAVGVVLLLIMRALPRKTE